MSNKKADFNDVSDKLKGWYGSVNPEVRGAILRGLAGAAVGGAVTGGIAAATPHDPEDHRSVISPALMGALLGGTSASLLPVGAKMLGGSIHLTKDNRRPAGARAVETVTDPLINNPLAAGGLISSAWYGSNSLRALHRGANELPRTEGYMGRVGKTLKDTNYWDLAERGLGRHHELNAKELAGVARTGGISRGRLALIPLSLILGAIGDKYLKGEY